MVYNGEIPNNWKMTSPIAPNSKRQNGAFDIRPDAVSSVSLASMSSACAASKSSADVATKTYQLFNPGAKTIVIEFWCLLNCDSMLTLRLATLPKTSSTGFVDSKCMKKNTPDMQLVAAKDAAKRFCTRA